jgi:hypothetical protein
MASQVGRVRGHDHEMTGARFDPLVATRAAVALHRLVGLDPADGYLGIRAHARTSAITTKAAATSA